MERDRRGWQFPPPRGQEARAAHDNPAAMKVYDRLGFRPVEEVTKLRSVDGEIY